MTNLLGLFTNAADIKQGVMPHWCCRTDAAALRRFSFWMLKWSDVTWVRLLRDNGFPQGRVWRDVMSIWWRKGQREWIQCAPFLPVPCLPSPPPPSLWLAFWLESSRKRFSLCFWCLNGLPSVATCAVLFVLCMLSILVICTKLLCIVRGLTKKKKRPSLHNMDVCLKTRNTSFHTIVTKEVEQKNGGLAFWLIIR